jgi:hypothetical protein
MVRETGFSEKSPWLDHVKISQDIFVDTGRGGCYLFSMKGCVSE